MQILASHKGEMAEQNRMSASRQYTRIRGMYSVLIHHISLVAEACLRLADSWLS